MAQNIQQILMQKAFIRAKDNQIEKNKVTLDAKIWSQLQHFVPF